jgi:hypothetical protein
MRLTSVSPWESYPRGGVPKKFLRHLDISARGAQQGRIRVAERMPPSPCRKYLQEFIDFAAGANRAPIGFYKAYPGLSVQDIHALIADTKPQPA